MAVAAVESREQEVEGDSIVSGCFIPERLIQLSPGQRPGNSNEPVLIALKGQIKMSNVYLHERSE